MCNPSPAKLMRSARRITKFLEQKPSQKSIIKKKPSLSVKILPQSNFDRPPPKTLSVSRLHQISIPACGARNLSYQKFPTTEVIPGIQNDDAYLFSSYIYGGTHHTTFVCSFCYNDYSFKSADSIRFHVQNEHRLECHKISIV